MSRGPESERIRNGIFLDSAAHSAAFVLDFVGSQRFTDEDSFDLHIRRINWARSGNGSGHVEDPSQVLAERYVKELFLQRIPYLHSQMHQAKFKSGYRLPWSVLAKALIFERFQRYREFSASPHSSERKHASHIPIIGQYIGTYPEELPLKDEIDRVVIELVDVLRRGNLEAAIDAISDCLNVGPHQIPPSVERDGKLLRVDFTTAVTQKKSTLRAYNDGLVGAYADMYQMDEFLKEKSHELR